MPTILRVWTADWLKPAIGIGAVSGLIALICLTYVVWVNGSSRNLALASGALGGAIALLIVQLVFELRSPAGEKDVFSVEYIIDRAIPNIRQWSYRPGWGTWRVTAEDSAGRKLGQDDPKLFDRNREKITTDMTMFSIVAFFFWDQQDWQLKHSVFKGKTTGTVTITEFGSGPDECTKITRDFAVNMLRIARNSFASVAEQELPSWNLCLPPNATMDISGDSLVIKTPFCEMNFTLQSGSGVAYRKPGTDESPQLANGDAQYEGRVINVMATVIYSRLRAQHVELPQYQAWAKRTLDGLGHWFEVADQ